MRGLAVVLALSLGSCLHGPTGAVWYGRGPATSPPSEPRRASVELARTLAASEAACRAVLEEASALGYEPTSSGQPCLRTRDKATPFHLSLVRDSDGGVQRELTFSWRGAGIEGGAYVPAYPAQKDEALRQQAATVAEWNDALARAAQRLSAAPAEGRTAEAAARFDRAVGLYQEGKLEVAVVDFEAAYAAQPRWEVLYNIAVAQQKLGRNALAHGSFVRYLAEGGAKVPAKRRADVEKALASLEPRLGRVLLQIVGTFTDVEVDGRSLGATPPAVLLLEPGRHELKAKQGAEVGAAAACGLAAGATAVVLLEAPAR